MRLRDASRILQKITQTSKHFRNCECQGGPRHRPFKPGSLLDNDTLIYHMCRAEEWQAAQASGLYPGSSQDAADGFIHFSTAAQIVESAARHRAGQTGLVLLSVRAGRLGTALKWEPSRGGQLFPHLYGPLPVDAVAAVDPLPLGSDGRHRFPNPSPGEPA
jgi:uncharacterized protein (DUF952 family)